MGNNFPSRTWYIELKKTIVGAQLYKYKKILSKGNFFNLNFRGCCFQNILFGIPRIL